MAADQIIEVAAGLIFRDGKLLITQRRPHDHLGGLWEFQGGKRECKESFQECLALELKEELGIEVQVGKLFDEVVHAYPEKPVHLWYFRCRLLDQEPQPLVCHAVAWILREELVAYTFPAADVQLVRLLKEEAAWPD